MYLHKRTTNKPHTKQKQKKKCNGYNRFWSDFAYLIENAQKNFYLNAQVIMKILFAFL